MMKIGSSVDYVRSGGMRNAPVTKAVEHLYATTVKFSGCVLLASRPAYAYSPRLVSRGFLPNYVLSHDLHFPLCLHHYSSGLLKSVKEGGLGGLVLRSQNRDRRVPDSKPNSIKDVGPVRIISDIEGQNPPADVA
ncbi:hypothetical protein AVEN_159022-1 [Araneus ventricosus]|uniref:Uncharacterized protein n=1 Tax=Araneus ventricosus TaxID=182803 RepID=A0A4Y2B996_ARAVE|nr:hypothetical protein AVEN_159022-1 [Araneus ventricosus]